MTKTTFAAAVFALLGMTGAAQAIPVITFQGVANTANIADFYNGGTDSLGYSLGYNYGVHFDGVAALNYNGAYAKGPVTMTIAPNLFGENVSYLIKFNAAVNFALDGQYATLSATQWSDSAYVASTRNPYCATEAACNATGYRYIHPSQLGGYILESNGTATTVRFSTDRLDNIEFVMLPGNTDRPPVILGSTELDRDIPEPASLALLGLGAFGFVAARRRSKQA